MTSSESNEGTTEPTADPRVVSSVIKNKPPVELLREDIKVVDRFGSLEVANGLADVIEMVEPPFTISISGAWGVGKTTLAKQLRDKLDSHVPYHQRVRCVEIDLWAEDIADLRRLVALKVAVGLQDHQSEKDIDKALKDKATEFDKELRLVQTSQERPKISIPRTKSGRLLASFVFVAVAALIWLLWGFTTPMNPTVEGTGAKFVLTVGATFLIWILVQSGLVLSVVTSSTSMQPAAEAIGLQLKFKDEVTKHQDRKVVIILDNLDRLTGEAAVATLAEVRSFMDFEKSRCVFLVPLDREALERHLRQTMGGDDRSARDYLDKFFNLDVLLTKPVTSDLRGWTRDLLTVLFPGVEASVLSPVAEYAAAAADGSPRATKRILNGVYTRAYLLPAPSPIRMDELVVVEALIARFPMCVNRLNAEPRSWLKAAATVRSTTDAEERRAELRWLLGRTRVAQNNRSVEKDDRAVEINDRAVEIEDEEFRPFANFLMLTRNVELRPESIRAILSLRPDRQWGLLHRGDEAAIALQNGDGATFAAILEDTPAADRPQTVDVAIDQIKSDLEQSLSVSVVNGINVLSLVMSAYEDQARAIRDAAADFLLVTPQSDFRLLTLEAIDFIFGPGLGKLPRGAVILDRATTGLTPGGTPDATAVVRLLATVSTDIDSKAAGKARPLLAKLSDPELEPLFGDVGRNRSLMVPEVEGTYRARLIAWDANDADQSQFETAAHRLQAIRGDDWSADDTADQVATKATTQVASLPDTAHGSIVAIAAMLKDVGPNPNIDALALVLAGSPNLALFKVGLGLASAPMALATVATARVTAAGLEEFQDLIATERSRLEAAGVDVATITAGRWAAGQGFEYARLTLAPGRDADADAIVVAAAGISDASVYVDIITAVLPVLVELKAERAPAGIVADLAKRVPTFKDATLRQLAPVVRGLQVLTVVDTVITALLATVSAAPASAIADTAAVVRAFVDAKVAGADALPPALAEHGAAIGAIDLNEAGWLVRRKGVKRDDVRTALAAMIKSEPAISLVPALDAVRSGLDKSWAIGKALVERAAVSPDGSRDEWLVLAERWDAPPTKGQRQARDDYASALDTAAQDPAAQATVARVRGKL